MRLQTHKRGFFTCSIIAILLLIGCITSICLFYLARLQTNNKYYHSTSPALYISDPRTAHIWEITDTSQLPFDSLLAISDIPLLPLHRGHKHQDNTGKYLIAIYPDSTWAVWQSLHPDKTQATINYFSKIISNNFTPIKEEKENCSIYHFATHNHHFFHLYTQPGIVGYSYNEHLLLTPANDHTLQQVIEERKTFTHNTLYIFCNDTWIYDRNIHNTHADSTEAQ